MNKKCMLLCPSRQKLPLMRNGGHVLNVVSEQKSIINGRSERSRLFCATIVMNGRLTA